MNRQIRRLGAALLICYTALVAQLTSIQVFKADELADHPENSRRVLRDFNEERGDMVTADGVVVARTEASEGRFESLRVYPEGDLYAHVTGFFSFNFGTAGAEKTYNDALAGETVTQEIRSLTDLFVERDRTGDLTLTLVDSVQKAARDSLGDREGSVVVLDPRDGAIIAMWSNPSFDPNALSSHDLELTELAREVLLADGENPLRSRAYQERFFPGSTFKVLTAGAGLEAGLVTPSAPSYPVTSAYTPPLTSRPIRNFGGSTCGGTLNEILRVSCNTAFAEMGAETIGPELMVSGVEGFGFNDTPPLDLPDVAGSVFPTDYDQDTPRLAQASIGQNDVQGTPLQMALVAAAVANEGTIMAPHVMHEIRDGEGSVVQRNNPEVWRRPLSPSNAATLRAAMIGVVERGTASGLRIDGMEVGGKTGTAQLGTDPPSSHAWIIAFAGYPGQAPLLAVAVLVEGQPGVSEQTGGRVAAPIARAVILAAVNSGLLTAGTLDGSRPEPTDDLAPTTDRPSTTAPTDQSADPTSSTSTTEVPVSVQPTSTSAPGDTEPPASSSSTTGPSATAPSSSTPTTAGSPSATVPTGPSP